LAKLAVTLMIKLGGRDKVKKLKIIWDIVDEIPENLGHGIEIYYFAEEVSDKEFKNFCPPDTRLLIAFVDGFGWYHGQSDEASIKVLSPQSAEFTSRALKGVEIIMEMNTHLSSYLYERKVPTSSDRIGQHCFSHVNG
jgi:hypothetical protein